jgi:glycosyltransferase involved in cell wall biosynthesis
MIDHSGEIGAVAIGRNEGQRLIRCLTSLRAEFETIVYVDSGSTDDSVEAAKQLGVTVVQLNMSVPFTAARARNEGFAKLKSLSKELRYVQFIDGDCDLAQGWISAAQQLLARRADVAIVCGQRRERYPKNSIYNRIIDDEWNSPSGEVLSCGGDALVRVPPFEAAGGYRSGLIAGEEPELCIRLRQSGWKVWRLNQEMTWHDIALSRFSQWWARGIRCGYGCTEVAWMYWRSPFGIWKRETLSAVFWAGLLPLAILAGTAIHPMFIFAALLYLLQMARMAIRRGPAEPMNWLLSAFTILDRFAVFQGLLILLWRRWRGKAVQLIEYK